MNPFELAAQCADYITEMTGVDYVDAVLIAGSGWASAVDYIGTPTHIIPGSFLPGFDTAVPEGHKSSVAILETDEGVVLVIPRAHLYMGATAHDVAHGIRVGEMLGARVVILTNAAGSTRTKYVPGDILLVSDHINNTGESPATEFVNMTDAYSEELRDRAITIRGIAGEAVYLQNRGQQYETPAEVTQARIIGADLVGMSTALETIAARECDMQVVALSLVTNMAAGLPGAKLDHEEVLGIARIIEPKLGQVLSEVVSCVLR